MMIWTNNLCVKWHVLSSQNLCQKNMSIGELEYINSSSATDTLFFHFINSSLDLNHTFTRILSLTLRPLKKCSYHIDRKKSKLGISVFFFLGNEFIKIVKRLVFQH